MQQTILSQPLTLNRSMVPSATQAPPYSPTLINLNQRYNMSANSLTEALLLLSSVYLSLVQPDPGPIKIGLHAVFPRTSISFRSEVIDPFTEGKKYRTFMNYPYVPKTFNISASYTKSDYPPKEVLEMLCKDVFPKNTITMLYINNPHAIQNYKQPTVSYLPKLMESLGLPIISYDTQFSPNARPKLSIQLAPTMGQMLDVMFAFLKRFGWTDFSFLCTLSYGCQDEISYIRLKIEESELNATFSVYGVEMYSFKLLSYVNFTDGDNETEVREKLLYELHKDSRISLVHGKGSEVKSIMDMAKKLNLTGEDYVWIFTAASITLSTLIDESYPLGSFVIGFNASRDVMVDTIKAAVDLWLDALNTLAQNTSDLDSIDFNTGFSCDRIKNEMSLGTNGTVRSELFWKYGEILYRYILKSKMAGDLEFDEYGVLTANKFFIMNVQLNINSSKTESSETKSPGRVAPSQLDRGESPRGSPWGSRNTERPSYRDAGRDGSDLSSRRESRIPFTRDVMPLRNHSRSSFSKDRETGYPLSRDRETESSDEQSHSSRGISETVSGSPFSRDRQFGSPIFKGQKSETYRRRDSESADSMSTEYGHPLSKDKMPSFETRHGSPELSRSPRTGSSDSSFHYDPSYRTFRNDTAALLEPLVTPVESHHSKSEFSSSVSSPDSDGKYRTHFVRDESSNDRHGFIRSDEDSSRSSSGQLDNGSVRPKNRGDLLGTTGSHNSHNYASSSLKTDKLDDSHRSKFPENEKTHRRVVREVKEKQIAKRVADWDGHKLIMYDITWPGGASKPPKGKPEKYILKAVTWQEDPHVIYREMKIGLNEDEKTCEVNSVPCKVYNRDKSLHRTNGTKDMCCTGLSIDLLTRLGEMLNFDVELSEVADDGRYGSPLNSNLTDWDGMLGMLIHKEADLAIGALSVTPERSAAVDFSVPFLQTGITIIVALRHGVISATAFLEPYDYPSWSLILLFSVHATGASIFIFEWLSPYGLDQGKTSFSVHKFSLFRSFWLIWAMLFGASVSTDQPRGIASRFLANIWALFAVVFCASYTANLAAFMITKDTYYDLSGIQDWRLKNPHHQKPPFKFATIANSSTDLNIKKNYRDIHQYMKNEAQTDVKDAIRNLKAGKIQAFIYDSTTLEYEVGKDDGCKLKTVGKRIAETGYGVAFPKRSVWVKEVDRALLQLQESGEIERLQKHWLARACHNKKETGVSSHTLGILNFTSAFVLLGSGVVLGVLILSLEHMYFRFGRKSLKKWDKCGCCSLVSLSMGQSLTFEQSVMEAMDYHKHHRCRDPLCETQLWKVKHDLDIALLKISQLRRQIANALSYDNTIGGDYGASSKHEREVSPSHNGAARKRRQQVRDAGQGKMDRSVNQPLLALEGKSETDEDSTPVQSPKHMVKPLSQRSSFPTNENKANGKESNSGRYSYPEQRRAGENVRRASGDRPVSRNTTSQRSLKTPVRDKQNVTDPDFHRPPPSFDEATSRYRSSPTDEIMTSSPSPPLPSPPSSPPPPAAPSPVHLSSQGHASALSDSNISNSSPSSDDKRYEPFILDSPESPSFSSFSETSDNRISCPGTLSKLSDEIPSTAVSQDMDSNFTSSPDMTKSLDDNIFPSVGYAGNQNPNAQNKRPAMEKIAPSNLHEDMKPETQLLVLNSSKEGDNGVNARRSVNNEDNIYVNVDDMIGKETSF